MESGYVFPLGLGVGAWHDQSQQARASSLNRVGRKASSVWAGKGGEDLIPWPTKEGHSSHNPGLGRPTKGRESTTMRQSQRGWEGRLKEKHSHVLVTKRMGKKSRRHMKTMYMQAKKRSQKPKGMFFFP